MPAHDDIEQPSQRWSDISADPNSVEVLAARNAQLARAMHAPVADRWDVIGPLAKGARVLDIGCVDHLMEALKPTSLHGRLRAEAASIVAADIDAEGIEALRGQGETAVVVDVDDPASVAGLAGQGPFDVVVAGELIEHLTRPLSLFELAAAVLAPGGRLVITTPNPFGLHRVRSGWKASSWENVDHSIWCFPSGIVELASRAGLQLEAAQTSGANALGLFGQWRKGIRRRVSLGVRSRRLPSRFLKHHELPLGAVIAARLAGAHRSAWLGETAVYTCRKPG